MWVYVGELSVPYVIDVSFSQDSSRITEDEETDSYNSKDKYMINLPIFKYNSRVYIVKNTKEVRGIWRTV